MVSKQPTMASQPVAGDVQNSGELVTTENARVPAPSCVSNLYEVSDKRSRVVAMEGVRGFAVLLVLFVHYDAIFRPYVNSVSPLFAISRFFGNIGNAGVDLFFVPGGYLIYGMLLKRRTS
jgi:hypothetical protein